MTNKISQYALYGAVIVLVLAVVYMFGASALRVGASVSVTNEYVATTTAQNTMFGGSPTGGKAIKNGYGSLGSVIITGANTGVFNIYDATTTNDAMRTQSVASSTILLASFPASTVAGTYTFDVVFTRGLLIEVVSGNIATSTITYR